MLRGMAGGALAGIVASIVACADTSEAPARPATADDADYVSILPLTNAEYSIVEMATAHGAFTVEVEVAPGVDTDRIARGIIEPVQHQYAEVLVYFYDREGDGSLPVRRVQWTAERGFSEIVY